MSLLDILRRLLASSPSSRAPRGFEWWEVDPRNEERIRHRESWLPELREDGEGISEFQFTTWLQVQHMLRGRGYAPEFKKKSDVRGHYFEVTVNNPAARILLFSEGLCWEIVEKCGRVDFMDAETPGEARRLLREEIRAVFTFLIQDSG